MQLLELLLRLVGSLFVGAVVLVFRVWQVAIPPRVKASVSSYSHPLFHHQNARNSKKTRRQVRVMAVLGSGGHTTELLKLMKRLKRDVYTPITFVVAETDKTSQTRTELDWEPTEKDSFAVIPRSREVGQSWSSTVWTTLRSFQSCLGLVYNRRPQLVLCNGPGTCIPICAAVLLFRVLGIQTDSKIVFCESFARVQHLSLTGKLLYYVADEFVVQWPQLQTKYPRTKHLGVIC
ncbi:UDP-N-acetylglucosamine transferase subunit ALG14 [Phytophthora megakarya]|uniref:UDP-N-acetylglucosamine transferase subunit ALG14 n=1 Tax=Phytophthora megakarya TaxID=4795 RepID=A0A225W9M4_9STRA|nr:UDP-N-acetylglucosamine transferase subunit ALG14 [Phytophthora megakarya]